MLVTKRRYDRMKECLKREVSLIEANIWVLEEDRNRLRHLLNEISETNDLLSLNQREDKEQIERLYKYLKEQEELVKITRQEMILNWENQR